jgi:tetratricopeptide (TPR) repeat protein
MGRGRKLYGQAVSLFHKTVGVEHPDLARTLMGFASMNKTRNRGVQAEEQYRQACDMSNRLLGEAHQFTLECRMGLSEVLVELNRFDEAQSILDEIRPRAERQFGPRMMPALLRRTVYLQMARMQYEDAERTLFEIQASVCERFAKEHPEQAVRLGNIAVALREKVGRRGADAAYIESLEVTQAIVPDPWESARALLALGTIRHRQERYAYAEALLRRCLNYLDQVKKPEYSVRARASRLLATSLQMLGRDEESESLLKSTLTLLQDSLGPQEPLTQLVAGDLRILYQRSGRDDEAAALPASASQ